MAIATGKSKGLHTRRKASGSSSKNFLNNEQDRDKTGTRQEEDLIFDIERNEELDTLKNKPSCYYSIAW